MNQDSNKKKERKKRTNKQTDNQLSDVNQKPIPLVSIHTSYKQQTKKFTEKKIIKKFIRMIKKLFLT